MTDEEMRRAGVVKLTEITFTSDERLAPRGDIYVRPGAVDIVVPCKCGDDAYYLLYMNSTARYTLENPFLLGEW